MYDNVKDREKVIKESAAMLIKFDSYKDHAAKGKVQTLYYKRPFEFGSLDQLLMIIDEVLDLTGFEKEPVDSRSLYGNEEGKKIFCIDEDIYEKKAESFQGDLIVRVLYRQHSSMQGEICINEKAVYFRSALELLRLLYEFLEHHFRIRILEEGCVRE